VEEPIESGMKERRAKERGRESFVLGGSEELRELGGDDSTCC